MRPGGRALIPGDIVRKILAFVQQGYTISETARAFGVSRESVSRIANRRTHAKATPWPAHKMGGLEAEGGRYRAAVEAVEAAEAEQLAELGKMWRARRRRKPSAPGPEPAAAAPERP